MPGLSLALWLSWLKRLPSKKIPGLKTIQQIWPKKQCSANWKVTLESDCSGLPHAYVKRQSFVCRPLSCWLFSHQWRQPRHAHSPIDPDSSSMRLVPNDSRLYQLTVKMDINPPSVTSVCLLTDNSEYSAGCQGPGHRDRLYPCLPCELEWGAFFSHVLEDGVNAHYGASVGIKLSLSCIAWYPVLGSAQWTVAPHIRCESSRRIGIINLMMVIIWWGPIRIIIKICTGLNG